MDKIKSIDENPNGLHARYHIKKLVRDGEDFFGNTKYKLQDVDINAEYFVLRLDGGGSDAKHVAACRKAVLCYANEIKDHLPELAADLIKRYSLPL